MMMINSPKKSVAQPLTIAVRKINFAKELKFCTGNLISLVQTDFATLISDYFLCKVNITYISFVIIIIFLIDMRIRD